MYLQSAHKLVRSKFNVVDIEAQINMRIEQFEEQFSGIEMYLGTIFLMITFSRILLFSPSFHPFYAPL